MVVTSLNFQIFVATEQPWPQSNLLQNLGHNSATSLPEKVQDVNDLMQRLNDVWAEAKHSIIDNDNAIYQRRRRLHACLWDTGHFDSGVDLSWNLGPVSVSSSHQTVSDYIVRQWFPNSQQSQFLPACRRLEKLALPSTFDTNLFTIDEVKLAVIQQQFWMKVCDVLGGQNILWLRLHIFSGIKTPQPLQDLCPAFSIFTVTQNSQSV